MILSPLQLKAFKENLKEKLDVAKGVAELIAVHEKFIAKVGELDQLINKKIGPKGEVGPEGPKGRDGKDGKDGKNGESPDVESIIKFVQSRINIPESGKHGKDGITPKKGVHYFTEEDQIHIAKRAAGLIKLPSKEEVTIDPMKIIEAIEKLPAGKRLSTKHIDGLQQTISAISNQTKRGYLHGGGDTVKAGTNITITTNSSGQKIINAVGSSFQQPTSGIVNGSNTVFAFTTAPNIIVVDNIPRQKIQSDGTVNWTGTTTITLSIAPNYDLYGL